MRLCVQVSKRKKEKKKIDRQTNSDANKRLASRRFHP
jgi:hypothetical protein